MTIAVVVGVLAFAFRYLTVRDFSNDHYMYLAWAQQLLAGELPGRDFVDPGMPLAYSLSALAQAVAPGPFSETVLTVGLLSVAAAVLFLVVAELTGSMLAGAGAALLATALQPRLYSYPKILVPAVTLLLVQLFVAKRSTARLILLGVWTIAAALLRYDFGLYVGLAVIAALLVAHVDDLGAAFKMTGVYVLATIAAAVPYAAFVQSTIGLSAHIEETLEFSRSDVHQLGFAWPGVPRIGTDLSSWTYDNSAAYLFYLAYGLLAALPLLVLARRNRQPAGHIAALTASTVLLALYVAFLLRHPIATRISDLAAVLAIALAVVVVQFAQAFGGALQRRRPAAALVAGAACAAAILVTAGTGVSVGTLAKVGERVRDTRIIDGWDKVAERSNAVRERGSMWPWNGYWPSGDLPDAIQYLAACTRPSDRVLLTWSAPEYYYFSRRTFAAGHAVLLPPRAFTGAKHQQRMLARLERQSVPVILINEDRRGEFERAYPLLAAYINERYVVSGAFTIYDGAKVAIAHRHDLQPTSTYGRSQWPCGFEPPFEPAVAAHAEAWGG